MSRLIPYTSLRKHSHFMPRHGAQVGFSLSTNVNTAFFQVPTLEFDHNARKCAQGPCVHSFLLVLGQNLLLSTCSKMTSGRAKWGNYEHSHPDRILKLWTQHRLLPVPRNWFQGTKYERYLNSCLGLHFVKFDNVSHKNHFINQAICWSSVFQMSKY